MNIIKELNMPNYQILLNQSDRIFEHLIAESPMMYQSLSMCLQGLKYFTLGVKIRIEHGLNYQEQLEEFYQMCNDMEFVTSKALCLCLLTGLDINLEESA